MRNLWKSAVAVVAICASLSTGLAGGATVKAHDAGVVPVAPSKLQTQPHLTQWGFGSSPAPDSLSSEYSTHAHVLWDGIGFYEFWIVGTFDPVVINGIPPISYSVCQSWGGTPSCLVTLSTNFTSPSLCGECGSGVLGNPVSIYANTERGSYSLGIFTPNWPMDCAPSNFPSSIRVSIPSNGTVIASWVPSRTISSQCRASADDPWLPVSEQAAMQGSPYQYDPDNLDTLIPPTIKSSNSMTFTNLDLGKQYTFAISESNGFGSSTVAKFGPDYALSAKKLSLVVSPFSTVKGLALPDYIYPSDMPKGFVTPKESSFAATAYGVYPGLAVKIGVAGQRKTCKADALGQCSVNFTLVKAGSYPVLAISGKQSTSANVVKPALIFSSTVKHGKPFIFNILDAPAKAAVVLKLSDGRIVTGVTNAAGTARISVATPQATFLTMTVTILNRFLGFYRVMVY